VSERGGPLASQPWPKRLGLLSPARGRSGPAGSHACRRDVHPVCSNRVQGPHGGAGSQGSLMAPLWWGRRHEHADGESGTPSKKNGGAAHRGGRTSVRWP
jgi:hypothetical protein